MSPRDTLFDYAAEVLAFEFKGAQAAPPPAAPDAAALQRMAQRCITAFARSGKRHLLLLGLASGGLAGLLGEALPLGGLFVCEHNLSLVRGLKALGGLDWWRRCGAARLALDASPWAQFLLLDRAGVDPRDALVLQNPEQPPAVKAGFRQLELLLTRTRPLDLSAQPAYEARLPRISAAAILSPREPDLPEFFAQFPPWLHELVLVWDGERVPGIPVPRGGAVRQLARPLDRDFSAQRNAMLAACSGDFVFCLDADERLAPEAWALLPRLCAAGGVDGWHFPRLTAYPGLDSVLTGFGLWPDVQLRLFRRTSGLAYVNPVHERLVGLAGGQALAPDLEILHLNRLRKGDDELRRKLAGFDAAGGGAVRHALSAEYPSVPRWLLASPGLEPLRGLLLPEAGGGDAHGQGPGGREKPGP